MTSGKASKRKRAEAAKPPPPVGKSRRGKASPKVLAGGAVAVAAIVGAIILAVSLAGGNGDSGGQVSSTAQLPEAGEVARLFRGIPQSGTVLGRPSAPVTMVEYVDLQCPFCRQFVSEVFPTFVEKYVRPGKVRVEARGLYFIGPDSERGMRAAQAAAMQNRMFQFMELLYYNQGAENGGWLSEDMVRAAAGSIAGLDVEKLLSDADSPPVTDKLQADDAQAEADEVQGTPTILVGPTGGELTKVDLASATDLASIEKAIAAAGS